MLVVHGLWLADGRLALWGEDADSQTGLSGRTRAARGTAPGATGAPGAARGAGRLTKPRQHPFAADCAALAGALGGLAERATAGAVALALPTIARTPCSSPELAGGDPPARQGATPELVLWQVPALEYDRTAAFDVLLAQRPVDLVVGESYRHLASVAGFAADLVARGQARAVTGAGAVTGARAGAVTGARAGAATTWRPVLTGPDVERARALVRALPPVGRADAAPGRVPDNPAAERVARTIDDLVDAAARKAAPGPVRACFRLIEPADPELESGQGDSGVDASRWRVEFALQAVDEPSLIVEAATVWRAAGATRVLVRYVADPQETLLAELGRATRTWPDLAGALRTARPDQLVLDTAGAHDFLRQRAPLLAGEGFGVLLPAWWGRSGARLGARLSASGTPTAPGAVARPGGFGLDEIIDYRWDLALDDQTLTDEELCALAELKTPLVRLRGQWVELDRDRLAAGLAHLADGGRMTVREVLRAGLADDGPGGLPVLAVDADGALGDLLSGCVDQRLTPVDPPEHFCGQLRPYQQRGLAWLAFLQSLGLGGVLADDMGLGKTVQVLALLAGDRAGCGASGGGPGDASGGGPTLLVCPMSLVGNWEREAATFAPHLRVHVHHGAERARSRAFVAAVRRSDLVITTYALAARDAEALGEIDWYRLVADEAQAIKNAATRQARAVRGIASRHRIALTGTPVENRLADLWSIMEFANPGLLGSAARFKQRFAEPVERHGDERVAAHLRRLTGPFLLRRVKTDKSIISDLPEKLEMEVVCNLTAEQASLYQAVVDDMLGRIEQSAGVERRGLILATMTRLKQVCNHPAQLLHDGTRLAGRSGKLARLEETLEEILAAEEKALIFTQYAEFGGMLQAYLGARFGREALFLHGGVAKRERDTMIGRFQDEGRGTPAVFVLSLKAGGTGLNLTAANHVIHVDRWWNPAVEDQATDRAFRIGQRRAVQVRKFICAGTLEEKIAAMIAEKRDLAATVVGAGEQWLTELSTGALRELLALEAGAVVE